MTPPRLAWGIACLDLAAILGVSLVSPALGVDGAILYAFGIASFSTVGALLITRVPGNPMGHLLLVAGTVLAAAMVIGAYADIGLLRTPAWDGASAARTIQGTLFIYPFFIALIGVPLIFPDGHLASRRFRWVAAITIANLIAWPVASVLRAVLTGTGPLEAPTRGSLELVLSALEALFALGTVVGFGGGAIAIWLRFRRGDPIERQQIKWLLAVVGVGATILPVSFLVPSESNPGLAAVLSNLTVVTLFALPIVIAIAILRYRLFEIDRIISRTIAYGVVTALLGGMFIGIVLALQGLLAPFTGQETLAVAISTLTVAALFQPVRRRVQVAVDQWFDRARYDADQTVRTFAARLRGHVDLGTVRSEIVGTASAAVRPATADIWLRGGIR
jgi:hypothetical protein